MNNYLDNYNYLNNYTKNKNYQSKYDNFNNQFSSDSISLYNPYQGFIRGNMFKDLDDLYKIKEPYEIKPINEQAELLTYIDSLSFACLDLNLYLDVNPNDRYAIDLFNQYRVQKNNLLKDYQNKYGPLLLNSDSLNTYPWAWNDKPWPWEL